MSITRRGMLAGTAALFGSVPLAGAVGGREAVARTVTDLEQLVQDALRDASGAGLPGISVGVLSGDHWYADGAGHLAGPGSPSPDGATVYQLGSITKTFTATLLALFADLGVLAVDDDANDHLPSAYRLPSEVESVGVRLLGELA